MVGSILLVQKLHEQCSVFLFIRLFTFLTNNTSLALIGRNPFRACFQKKRQENSLKKSRHMTSKNNLSHCAAQHKII